MRSTRGSHAYPPHESAPQEGGIRLGCRVGPLAGFGDATEAIPPVHRKAEANQHPYAKGLLRY